MGAHRKWFLIMLIAPVGGCLDKNPLNEDDEETLPRGDAVATTLNLSAPQNFTYDERGDSLTDSPLLSWDPVDEALSYEIAIGTSQGASDVLDWTDVGMTSVLSQSDLSLPNGVMLYASVRAIASDGTKGEAAEGDGWKNLACPTGYIKVFGNASPGLGGSVYTEGTRSLYDWDTATETLREISDFCVMKYEAKNSGSAAWSERAVSTAAGLPWVYIPRTLAGADNDATEACEAIGSGFYLIGNHHWQAIARDLESVPENYDTTLADPANHAFNRGHSNGSSALAASAYDDEGCYGLGTNTHDGIDPGADCGGGWHLNKRTHILSNGEVIWDFSGNALQWVRDDNNVSQGSNTQMRLIVDNLKWGPAGDYSNQTGRRAGLGAAWWDYDSGAVIRGGRWNHGPSAGAFFVRLNHPPTELSWSIGFRCVFAP